MNEKYTFQEKFRLTLIHSINHYLKENPKLEQNEPDQHKNANDVLNHARNKKLTPMLLWSEIKNIDESLPRPFYRFFHNALGSILKAILEQYPLYKLNLYFMQEQFELMQRTESTRSGEVSDLRNQAQQMQQQLSSFTKKLTELNNENKELRQLNLRLSEENLHLKEQLEQLLASGSPDQRSTTVLHHSLTEQIHQLQNTKQNDESKIAVLMQEKDDLFEKYHNMTIENTALKEKNRKLFEINTRLLKEKIDLTKIVTNGANNQETDEHQSRIRLF